MSKEVGTTDPNLLNAGSMTPGFIGTIAGLILLASGGLLVVTNLTNNTGWLIAGGFLSVSGLAVTLFFLSGFMNVREHEIGILIRKIFGKKMPQGQIVARSFDQIGIQADTLMPGFYWFNPIKWSHKVKAETEIGDDEIGQVTAIDGKPLPPGRLLGDEVPECHNFQDARIFLNLGCKGPQIGYLRPGTYRINTEVFTVVTVEAQTIKDGYLGTVVAKDGKSLPSKFIIAPEPTPPEGKTIQDLFQDPQEFIKCVGYRGPQLATLQPGKYYINPLMFTVNEVQQGVIEPGYVGVIISKVGEELATQPEKPTQISDTPGLDQPVHEPVEVVLQTDMKKRGIIKEPVAAGSYNLNPLAYTVSG